MRIFIYQPPEGVPDIIYEDDDYLAINKPSGLLSNPGRAEATHDCALTRLQTIYPNLILVHRLDCDTSGVLVFAKNKPAESALKKQLQLREVKKEYRAWVHGHIVKAEGIINLPLAPNEDDRPLQKIDKNGKPAITRYQVIKRTTLNNEPITEVALFPETGRTHQLRVHLLSIGHPILGDDFYAPEEVKQIHRRLCLHAKEMQFESLKREVVCISAQANFQYN